MTLHPLAAQFAGVADAYERGRPEYAPAVVGAITSELGVGPDGRVLDLAAGTGKLTRALVHAGLDVVAVEPQAALRELLVAGVGAERVREGIAESIPIEDRSVQAVTVADAFHWFDPVRALAEIRRVLEPGGGLAVLTAGHDWREASWAHDVGELLSGLRPEHPHFDGPPWQDAVRAAGGWSEPREILVRTAAPATPETFVDYLASLSWIAALPEGGRGALLDRARAIITAGHTPPEMRVSVVIGVSSLA
jgi:SAM-dependent methyltransferase